MASPKMAKRLGRVEFERTSGGYIVGYYPERGRSGGERSRRVVHVGRIERRGGKWLWETADKRDAGLEEKLEDAQLALCAYDGRGRANAAAKHPGR